MCCEDTARGLLIVAITGELERQAEIRPALYVRNDDYANYQVSGPIDIGQLADAIIEAVELMSRSKTR